MDLAKFSVSLKTFTLLIFTALISGYTDLAVERFTNKTIWFYIITLLGIILGFIILKFITDMCDLQIAKSRHTLDKYYDKVTASDRTSRLLQNYFLGLEIGIISGAIIINQPLTGTSIYNTIIFAGAVAIFVVLGYVIIYFVLQFLSKIHLIKRRKLRG